MRVSKLRPQPSSNPIRTTLGEMHGNGSQQLSHRHTSNRERRRLGLRRHDRLRARPAHRIDRHDTKSALLRAVQQTSTTAARSSTNTYTGSSSRTGRASFVLRKRPHLDHKRRGHRLKQHPPVVFVLVAHRDRRLVELVRLVSS